MTATTKEQREELLRLHGKGLEYLGFTKKAKIYDALPALLSDSERLAAIEAATGEEANSIAKLFSPCIGDTDETLYSVSSGNLRRAAEALRSLSAKVAGLTCDLEYSEAMCRSYSAERDEANAKVAEQAEEIERLKNEREKILLTVFGGEDAPGYAASLGLEDVKRTMEWWHGVLRDQNRLFDALERLHTPRPAIEYHEDMGSVLWHHMPICEPPYVGSQLDEDWAAHADWYTHFTPLPDCNEINDNATIRAQMEGVNG